MNTTVTTTGPAIASGTCSGTCRFFGSARTATARLAANAEGRCGRGAARTLDGGAPGAGARPARPGRRAGVPAS
ncbi:hypothetical protein ACFQ9X_52035 [Catenulispora yoronensis]